MSFNSIPFLFFLLIFFPVWTLAKRKEVSRYITLVSFSFLFYAWWDWRFLFLIIFSGLVDYGAAIAINKYKRYSQFFLIFSLLVNLGSLGIFKYSHFFAQNLNLLFYSLGIHIDFVSLIPEFALILPVGISFYTFQSMSYTIDVYNGRLKPTEDILQFFSFLAMFPQLVAGPIVRAKDLLVQLAKPKDVDALMLWNGLQLVLIGFFNKVVLADNIAYFVNTAFGTLEFSNNGSMYWWVAMIGFSLQIYFDFAGYSLIARGLAKLMGFHFRINFNHPYFADSLKDFWRRWHISLSTWFRDYVYIPLGGSKKSIYRSYLNLWIVMIVSGFWHGASLNFIIWGVMHAFFQTIERYYIRFCKGLFLEVLQRFFVLAQVALAWVFFRADTLSEALTVLSKMLVPQNGVFLQPELKQGLFFISLGVIVELIYFLGKKYRQVGDVLDNSFVQIATFVFMFSAIVLLRGPEQGFIYFQF